MSEKMKNPDLKVGKYVEEGSRDVPILKLLFYRSLQCSASVQN